MTPEIKEAIALLLPYVRATRNGTPTGYGTVIYCSICGNPLNAGCNFGHLPDCKGEAAKKLLEDAIKPT
jgi:hypothetical protein